MRYFFSLFYICSLAFLILLRSNVFGQDKGLNPERSLSQYHLNIWASEQGLPSQGANGIVQSEEGYIWLATYEGLSRFDGISIDPINPVDTENRLSINSFKSIYKEPEGKLWMAANGGGLLSYYNNKWEVYNTENGLPSNIVNSVHYTNNKILWVGTANGAAYMQENKFTQNNIDPILTQVVVNDIAEDNEGNLWFATMSNGLIKASNKGKVIKHYTVAEGLNSDVVHQIHIEKITGSIWIGTNKGIKILFKGEKLINFAYGDLLSDKTIRKIYEDKNGSIWIGTNRGLSRFNNNRLEFISENSNLSIHDVTDITEDNNGSLWVSTYRSGFYQLVQGKFITYSTPQGLAGKTINGVIEIAKDSILVATNNGLSQFKQGWNFSPALINGKAVLENKDVRDLIKDSKGNFWFATADKLYLYSADQELKIFSKKDGLASNYVRYVYEDRQNNIWIATENGLNLYKDGTFKTYTKEDGLSNNRIHFIYQDTEGIIWISTEEGLNKFSNGKFENFFISDGLSGNVVFKIHEDADQVLWIGTNGGITRLKNGELSSITKKDGLKINSVFDILEDRRGFFWIPNNQGIYRIDKEQLNVLASGGSLELDDIMYKAGDGMMVNSCTANARSLISSKGEYWIPTPEGVTVIPYPEHPDANNIPPKILVESIYLNGKEIPYTNPLNLPSGNNQLVVNFTGLDYHSPERVSFSYSLSGFLSMTPKSKKREAVLTNIPPGEYKFTIVAFNNDNAQSNFSFTINKEPQFYQTSWFVILIAILSLALLALVVKYFISPFKRENKRLEKLVEERTAVIRQSEQELIRKNEKIEDKNKELENSNNKLIELNKEKNNLIGIVAHDLKSPLNHITGLINIIKLSGDNLNEEQNEFIQHILNSTARLNNMISHILDVEAIESGKLRLHMTDIEMFETIETVISGFTTELERKNMEIIFDNQGSYFPIFADEKIIIQIFENLISNAIKFTPSGKKIFVKLFETETSNIRIEVKDQGPGVSSADMHRLFGKYQKLSARPTAGEHSTGLGLSIVKKYVEALNGKVWCESTFGKGATFIVELKKTEKIAEEKKKFDQAH
ncbi:MAG: hypothetical protein CMO01_24940 [Thalassobius sp.]|nr:hypothetical protein [Thalassovita sp.]